MAEIHYMTQEGLDKLKKDLADALAQRPVISAAIAEARERETSPRMLNMTRRVTLRGCWR